MASTKEQQALQAIEEWTRTHGKAICPPAGCADTYGNGMRDAKRQVVDLLRAAPSAYGNPDVAGLVERAKRWADVFDDDEAKEIAKALANLPAAPSEPDPVAVPPELEDFASRALSLALRHCMAGPHTVERLARGIGDLARQARKKPAPTDAEREREIEAWGERMNQWGDEGWTETAEEDFAQLRIDALALMRSRPGPFCPRCQKVQDEFAACQKAIGDEEMGRGEDDPEDTIADLRKQLEEAREQLREERRLHAEERGIHKELLAEIKELLAEIAELRERVKKLDGDVDHFHRKWKDAETRAEKAEVKRGYWIERAKKAEAGRDALRADLHAIHRWLDDRADVEDPDQRPNAEMQMLSEFFEDQKPAEPPKDREGDDVLRGWMRMAERQHLLGNRDDAALHELCRRALGEER